MTLSSVPRRLALALLPRRLWFALRGVHRAWTGRLSGIWHRRLLARLGGTVQSGPFRGMRYVEESVGSSFLPKLLGTYELELHPALEKLRVNDFDLVVDVGAAEGWYAVGATLLWPSARVIAFETHAVGRLLCAELASRNGAKRRVEIHGFADLLSFRAILNGAAAERTLVIMDVEGAEIVLLDPVAAPELSHTAILVECHDEKGNPVAATLRSRFAASHEVETVPSRARSVGDFPLPDRPPLGWAVPLLTAMAEHRPRRMEWLVMLPRAGAAERRSP
ncbi:MAG: hypothetical protein IT578_03160 [Verrucomicrobiae bacterium]|nr:hypothetical protein [Verrucomicrobiae bacterium]